jgi:hypothetical protein
LGRLGPTEQELSGLDQHPANCPDYSGYQGIGMPKGLHQTVIFSLPEKFVLFGFVFK